MTPERRAEIRATVDNRFGVAPPVRLIVKELLAEVERLEAVNVRFHKALNDIEAAYSNPASTLQLDASRWRYVRERPVVLYKEVRGRAIWFYIGDEADAAVDKARGAG